MKSAAKMLNRFRMVSAYFNGQPRQTIYPQEVAIELTNHCNLACVMCPHSVMQRDKGFMSEQTFRKIIDDIKGHSELVYLHGIGESVLHKNLCAFADYAASRGLTTVLSTNALPLTEKSATDLLNSSLHYLIVALDGGTKPTYEAIRIKGDFDKLVQKIKMLLRLRRELRSKTRIQMQMIVMPENAHEVEQFKALFTAEEKKEIFQFRFKPLYETYATPKTGVAHTKPCYWLWNMMSIAWNGDVQLCCMDYEASSLNVNVHERSVADIWNSRKMAEMRDKHTALAYHEMPLCNDCDIPEHGYFSNALILASTLLSANQVRQIMPIYEKFVLLRDKLGKPFAAPVRTDADAV